MFALMVKDNSGYNSFGYNLWNGFSQTNNDVLQKVEVKAKFTTPNVRSDGFKNNEKTIQTLFYSSYKFAQKETDRINQILFENDQPRYDFIIIGCDELSKKLTDYE